MADNSNNEIKIQSRITDYIKFGGKKVEKNVIRVFG